MLIEDHITSPASRRRSRTSSEPRVQAGDKAESWLRALMEKSPEKKVQAPAMFVTGTKLMSDKKPKPERRAEGRKLLEQVQKDFAGIKSPRGQEYAAIAVGHLFEIDYLQIGKVAAGLRDHRRERREVQALRLPRQSGGHRFLGQLVRPLRCDAAARKVAREATPIAAFRPDRDQQ